MKTTSQNVSLFLAGLMVLYVAFFQSMETAAALGWSRAEGAGLVTTLGIIVFFALITWAVTSTPMD